MPNRKNPQIRTKLPAGKNSDCQSWRRRVPNLVQENRIPQGLVISPTIFSVLVNDLKRRFQPKALNSHNLPTIVPYGAWEKNKTLTRLQKQVNKVTE